MILLCAFQFRLYRIRRLVETAALKSGLLLCNLNESSEDTHHLYLEQKAELDNVEHQRYEVEAGDETTYETQGTPVFELPTEDTMLGRQELRGVEHPQELMAAH